MVPHKPRRYSKAKPHHVTIKTNVRGVNFNQPQIRRKIIHLFNLFSLRNGIALSAYSILSNHIHIIVQFDKESDLGKLKRDALFCNAMRMFVSQVSRAVNRFYGRKGQVFPDRYWMKVLKTAGYIVNGFRYVLFNTLKHLSVPTNIELHQDPRSSLFGYANKLVKLKMIKSTRYVLLRGEANYKNCSYESIVSALTY